MQIHCRYDALVPPGSLTPNPANPRKRKKGQVSLLAKLIAETGWRRSVVVSKRSGFIVRGHGAALAAKQLGCEIPVEYQEFASEAEETAYLIADNRTNELSHWDDTLISVLSALDAATQTLAGFDPVAIARLLALDAQKDVPPAFENAQAQWDVKLGDLYTAGPHRIMCGDSTDATTVARLFGEDRAEIMVTDPPYGVMLNPTRPKGAKKGSQPNRGKVLNDDRADWSEAYVLARSPVAYVWHAGVHTASFAESLAKAGYVVRAQIIWAKKNHAFGRGDYHYQHEPCFYCVKRDAKRKWYGGRTQTTLWEIPNEDLTSGHGTQKPVECMARPLLNHTLKGGIVYDPFLGSGTTIVAAHLHERVGFGLELSPAYVAGILSRLTALGLPVAKATTPRRSSRDSNAA